jgi:hypothetical protein
MWGEPHTVLKHHAVGCTSCRGLVQVDEANDMKRVRAILAIACATGILALLRPNVIHAADKSSALIDSPYSGEFIRTGPAFACKIKPPTKLSAAEIEKLSEHACLRIGSLAVGNKAGVLKAALGEPSRVAPGPSDTTSWVYFFGKTPSAPYLVASVWHDTLVALQVTGREPADAYGFNGVKLGDATEAVIKRLGKPMVIRPTDEATTTTWSYQPWPFSFEVTDGHVTSIRLADPRFN